MAGPSCKEFWHMLAGQLHKMSCFFFCVVIYDDMFIILMSYIDYSQKEHCQIYDFY